MPAWISEISSRLGGLFSSRKPAVHFGAFGKHPGWNDHLDDIGLDSEPLLAAKQYLYVQGIGGVIDAGMWEALPQGQALAEFHHVFIWRERDNLLVGRLWSSSDGKGRTKYPMVVCAHFENRNETSMPDIAPLLDQVEQACKATQSPDDVRRLVAQARQTATTLPAIMRTPPAQRGESARRIGVDPASEEAARIAYAVESHFSPVAGHGVAKSGINLKLGRTTSQPQHIRLPAEPGQPITSQEFWGEFLDGLLPGGVPQLYIASLDRPWLDLIVGLPTSKQLFCLRAGDTAIPLASHIPFNLSAGARMQAGNRWQRFLAGE